jgi:uncharacterized lipoprotein YddW (UPF0748 family)
MGRSTATAICITLILLLFCRAALAQDQENAPKREFRAVWVATVKNIDFPRQATTDPESLRAQYRRLLRGFRELGLNAVIFQVRPAADAFYPSDLAPWSAFLTGRQGRPPDDGFDPLAFFIEETHRYGMEFHAWLNPYRATMDLDTFSLAPDHVFHRHRQWLYRYGDRLYFNPALPEVQQHLIQVVTELVEGYDLDAIHLDDYFYPYKIQGERLPDSLDFRRFHNGAPDIDFWRRNNTDSLVAGISSTIRRLKPYVRFGISPFGVWRNQSRDPEGSPTEASVTNYDDLYADILKWLRRGWIDYVVPQLYWHVGFEVADYQALLEWWSRHAYGKQLYIGHAAYKVDNNPEEGWSDPAEIPRQISLTRRNPISRGSVFFRSEFLFRNPLGIADSLRRQYRNPALIPESIGPASSYLKPPDLKKIRRKRDHALLRWRPHKDNRGHLPAYYVIYRFEAEKGGNLSEPENIIAVTPFNQDCDRYHFIDETIEPDTLYIYTITAVNRYHAESLPSPPQTVRSKSR